MNFRTSILALMTALPMLAVAQSKSELQASLAAANARNDSLIALDRKHVRLLDSLQTLTGVKVQDLDTVKTVLAARQAARTAAADSLSRTNARLTKLQSKADSLSRQSLLLHGRIDSLNAVIAGLRSAAVPAGTATVTATGSAGELLKLNGMLEQGLITKEEFMKMKKEIVK